MERRPQDGALVQPILRTTDSRNNNAQIGVAPPPAAALSPRIPPQSERRASVAAVTAASKAAKVNEVQGAKARRMREALFIQEMERFADALCVQYSLPDAPPVEVAVDAIRRRIGTIQASVHDQVVKATLGTASPTTAATAGAELPRVTAAPRSPGGAMRPAPPTGMGPTSRLVQELRGAQPVDFGAAGAAALGHGTDNVVGENLGDVFGDGADVEGLFHASGDTGGWRVSQGVVSSRLRGDGHVGGFGSGSHRTQHDTHTGFGGGSPSFLGGDGTRGQRGRYTASEEEDVSLGAAARESPMVVQPFAINTARAMRFLDYDMDGNTKCLSARSRKPDALHDSLRKGPPPPVPAMTPRRPLAQPPPPSVTTASAQPQKPSLPYHQPQSARLSGAGATAANDAAPPVGWRNVTSCVFRETLTAQAARLAAATAAVRRANDGCEGGVGEAFGVPYFVAPTGGRTPGGGWTARDGLFAMAAVSRRPGGLGHLSVGSAPGSRDNRRMSSGGGSLLKPLLPKVLPEQFDGVVLPL